MPSRGNQYTQGRADGGGLRKPDSRASPAQLPKEETRLRTARRRRVDDFISRFVYCVAVRLRAIELFAQVEGFRQTKSTLFTGWMIPGLSDSWIQQKGQPAVDVAPTWNARFRASSRQCGASQPRRVGRAPVAMRLAPQTARATQGTSRNFPAKRSQAPVNAWRAATSRISSRVMALASSKARMRAKSFARPTLKEITARWPFRRP